MKSFIVLTFGFLALGFFELSGGTDFDPQSAREAAVFARMENEAQKKETSVMFAQTQEPVSEIEAAPPKAPILAQAENTQPAVTRAVLNLVALDTVLAPADEPAFNDQTIVNEDKIIDIAAPAALETEASDVVLPSLIYQGNTTTAASIAAPLQRDVRAVTGTVVNVRGGPGTRFDVVSQLALDDQVEILTDNGQGWVEMRPLNGGPTGWMADFLLTGG